MLTTTNAHNPSDIAFSIPKEIMIKRTSNRSPSSCISSDSSSYSPHTAEPNHPISPLGKTVPMQWEVHKDLTINSDPSRKEVERCVVSLTSSDCSSSDCDERREEPIMLDSADPLDYRQDWTRDLTNCIDQNPQLFSINEGFQMNTCSDENSLCSCLSEEYEIESVGCRMEGIWDI